MHTLEECLHAHKVLENVYRCLIPYSMHNYIANTLLLDSLLYVFDKRKMFFVVHSDSAVVMGLPGRELIIDFGETHYMSLK